MNRKTFDTLRKIRTIEDVQPETVYFSAEHSKVGNDWLSYCNLYDENFKIIEIVRVLYTSAIKHLKRITTNKNELALQAHTLEDIGNGFYHVISNKNTTEGLIAMAASVKPSSWK